MVEEFALHNIFEAKFRPKRDSVDKKIKLFDNIRVGGNYNFAADSLKFSDVSATGTTRLFKGISNFNFSMRWTPYTADVNNRKIDRFYWRTNGKFLRFTNASFRMTSNLSVREIKKLLKKDSGPATSVSRSSSRDASSRDNNRNSPSENKENSFLKFLEGFNLSHNFAFNANKFIDQPTSWEIQTHNISLRVSKVQVTQKWSMTVGNIGYDFKNKRPTYPDFGIFRDLHCWEASFRWQEYGTFP